MEVENTQTPPMPQAQINQIEVVQPKMLRQDCVADRACEPESLFDIIERCKICKRCV